MGRRLQFRNKGFGDTRVVGIDEYGKARGVRQQLVQQRQPLIVDVASRNTGTLDGFATVS